MEATMHREHAELISALRRENERLTIENAEVSALRAIIDAQDELLKHAAKLLADSQATMIKQQKLIEEALKCP
jgi:hypothetical protein